MKECPECGAEMDLNAGWWICPECGHEEEDLTENTDESGDWKDEH
jgi:uncharacterized Zn finger protein (UPF0148 family)